MQQESFRQMFARGFKAGSPPVKSRCLMLFVKGEDNFLSIIQTHFLKNNLLRFSGSN